MHSVFPVMSYQDTFICEPTSWWSGILAGFGKTADIQSWVHSSDLGDFIQEHDKGQPFEWNLKFSTNLITRFYLARFIPAQKQVTILPLISLPDYQDYLIDDYKIPSIRKVLSTFLHDFNNHLTVLLPNMEAAQMFSSPEAKNHKYISASMKGMDGLNAYANLVASICRSPRSMIRFFDLAPYVNEVISEAHEKFPGLSIHVNGDYQSKVAFFEESVRDLFNSLLKNVWENDPASELTIRFDQISQPYYYALPYFELNRGEFLRIRFIQSSPGPSVETQSRMYDPFFTTRSKGKDEGIGLSLAKILLDSAAGTIRYSETSEQRFFEIIIQKTA
ncbi:MAG: HAMP domain-containing histidine kinase [Bacteroidetes bacterium]|nr:HAMP domain-containing histidine kinase [Bacteroidota bacterium]